MMKFISLNRTFAPFRSGETPSIDAGQLWGARHFGWETWDQILKRPRVVILAEAGSGKTEEFKGREALLKQQGVPCFFIAIEDLADSDVTNCLSIADAISFKDWIDGVQIAYFLLDSIDEARLNGKKLSVALRKLAHALGDHLQRAHVVISCRASDWKGESDIEAFKSQLPYQTPPARHNDNPDPHAKLLEPIFGPDVESEFEQTDEKDSPQDDVYVALLMPLSVEQRQIFATALGISNIQAFERSIKENALEDFVDHPRDVMLFARYWTKNGRLGSLKDMTESAVSERLAELDSHRPDKDLLTLDQARRDVERLAAGLTLAKSFTIAFGRDQSDEIESTGSVKPTEILLDRTAGQIEALLRRGIFAPATYGRVRFYHRGVQEYLTAMWLDRLIREGKRLVAVERLVFVSIYGIDTLVLSLAPAAAWLSLTHATIRDKLIERDPPVLLRHGDPRSLPLSAKERLLESFAALHARGDVADDSLDRTMLGMFADPSLGPAIRRAWAANDRDDFRTVLLRIIREGAVGSVVDLATAVVIDEQRNDYMRTVAAQVIAACQDAAGLWALVELATRSTKLSARLAPSIAVALFPRRLNVTQLFSLIRRTPSQGGRTGEGFGQFLGELWANCDSDEHRLLFLQELTKICFEEPHVADWSPISKHYYYMAESLENIAIDAVERFAQQEPSELVALLTIIERTDQTRHVDDGGKPTLLERIASLPKLKRALFWADVALERAREKSGPPLTEYWQFNALGRRLWCFEQSDETWLRKDLNEKPQAEDRQIALSALVFLIKERDDVTSDLVELEDAISGDPVLVAKLINYMRPPERKDDVLRHKRQVAVRNAEQRLQKETEKASWVEFKQYLNRDPSSLTDVRRLAAWPGPLDLFNLYQWLLHRVTKQKRRHAIKSWRVLEEGFGPHVAKAFSQGMRTMWRVTSAERPARHPNGGSTKKKTVELACSGLMLEAADNAQWPKGLSAEDATRATQHICWSDTDIEELLDGMIEHHSEIAKPIVFNSLEHEWFAEHEHAAPLFRYISRSRSVHLPWMIDNFIRLLAGDEPSHGGRVEEAVQCIEASGLTAEQKSAITTLAVRAFEYPASSPLLSSNAVIRLLFQSDAELAGKTLNQTMADLAANDAQVESMTLLTALFGGFDRSACVNALSAVSVTTLTEMVRRVYELVSPDRDCERVGPYAPTLRDNAERARGQILNALLMKPGVEAYRATLRLAEAQIFLGDHKRFHELARGKAERDAEIGAWTAAQVVAFETSGLAPATTGVAFFEQSRSVLDEIEVSLRSADASTASLLRQATSEDQVQLWLAEQLTLRAHGRYHVAREPIVANKKEPDITLSSATCAYEVAIEVKHGGKDWSGHDLYTALICQLSGQYLKPNSRQQGFLVITNHQVGKNWQRPDNGQKVAFMDLIAWLKQEAKMLDDKGHLVDVVGMDLTS